MILMSYIAYADRKDDVNIAIPLLTSSSEKILCYRCEPGYGITAFFHRLCYLLHSTKSIVCLYAELSDNVRSPLHEALKKVVLKDGALYQTLQLYADEYYGEHTQTLLDSLLRDLPTMGETLSQLVSRPKAAPIYTGFYSDAIKNLFFHLLKNELAEKTVIFFIDNIQYLDNSSMYDVLALAEMNNVKLVFSCTGNSKLSEKLLLELEIANDLKYLDFNEPPVECVQELWENQARLISKESAQVLIHQSEGNIRKLVYSAQHGALPNAQTRTLLANEILILIHTLQGHVSIPELLLMLADSPTCNLADADSVTETIHALVHRGLLSSVLQISGTEIFYARVRDENQQIWNSLILNQADALIYQDIVFRHLRRKATHSFEELEQLFELANLISPQSKAQWGRMLLVESLQRGSPISANWIDAVRKMPEAENQFLCAVCLFKTWKYTDALDIIMPLWRHYPHNRNVKILYALTLNRCRKHGDANTQLWELIRTSTDLDEKAVLLSITISNSIHSGHENVARNIVKTYRASISASKKYGYFLRNAATLFQADDAKELWDAALVAFKASEDEYGELTTIVNMARIYIRSGKAIYARDSLEKAYNGLMSYGMEQLHIVSNNLGVSYLYCGDIQNAKKHLRIARLITKSIMPRTYITINDCCVLLEERHENQALTKLLELKSEIDASSLPRLKRRYYLALAGIYCICEDYESAMNALTYAEKFKMQSFIQLRQRIRECCMEQKTPDILQWNNYVSPAFLEYWVFNPLSIMSENALSSKAFIQDPLD